MLGAGTVFFLLLALGPITSGLDVGDSFLVVSSLTSTTHRQDTRMHLMLGTFRKRKLTGTVYTARKPETVRYGEGFGLRGADTPTHRHAI